MYLVRNDNAVHENITIINKINMISENILSLQSNQSTTLIKLNSAQYAFAWQIIIRDKKSYSFQIFDANGNFITKERGRATDSKCAKDYLESNVEEAEARKIAQLEPDVSWLVDDPHEASSYVEKYFWWPTAVLLDKSGRIYVNESNRHRIQIFNRNF